MFGATIGRFASRMTASRQTKIGATLLGTSIIGLTWLQWKTSWARAEVKPALDVKNPGTTKEFKIAKITKVNHNTNLFTLALEDGQRLGTPVTSCIMVGVPGVNGPDGKPLTRPYTPLDDSSEGFFELLIKHYEKGQLTPQIFKLKVGDALSVKGPFNKLPYKPNMKKRIGMVAGGTGLTPMLQLVHEVLRNPDDKTEITFVFANISEEDILLRYHLEWLASNHKNFKLHYVLERPPANWTGSVGYVTMDVLRKHMPSPSDDNLVLVCGPPPMMKMISGSKAPDFTQGELEGYLKDLGYNKDQVFKF